MLKRIGVIAAVLSAAFFLLSPNEASQFADHAAHDSVRLIRASVEKTVPLDLDQLLEQPQWTGLLQEGYSTPDFKRAEEQAKVFLRYQGGRLGMEEKAKLFAECLQHPEKNLFCQFLDPRWRDRFVTEAVSEEAPDEAELLSGVSVDRIREAWSAADFDFLSKIPRRDLLKALDYFVAWDEDLERVTEKASGKWTCPDQKILVALALKTEEYFPEESFRERAKGIYRRIDQCGLPNDALAEKLRYRLALLHVWDGKCDEALPVFERLSNHPDGDFVSRSLYWQARCAQRTGDRHRFEAARHRLMENNPTGYHNLLIHQDQPSRLLNMVIPEAPRVIARSKLEPQWNPLVAAVEILQRLKERTHSARILAFLSSQIHQAEPEFRLFVSVLALRNNDTISQFKILSQLFYDEPRMLTVSTLKLFFPFKKYPTLWEQKDEVDPFMALALMRQESAFNEHARSRVGALGLMQLMPDTARIFDRQITSSKLVRPEVNLRIGVRYLRTLLKRFDGDAELTLAAYNAGPHRVDSWLERYPTEDRMLFLELIPFSETRNYVALITRNYFWYLHLYGPRTPAEKEYAKLPLRRLASFWSGDIIFPGFEAQ